MVRRLPRVVDLTLTFHVSYQRLARRLPTLFERTSTAGMVWVCWPKKAAQREQGISSDLDESRVRDLGLGLGFVDVKIAAIDQTWSGLKFVRRLVDREASPVSGPVSGPVSVPVGAPFGQDPDPPQQHGEQQQRPEQAAHGAQGGQRQHDPPAGVATSGRAAGVDGHPDQQGPDHQGHARGRTQQEQPRLEGARALGRTARSTTRPASSTIGGAALPSHRVIVTCAHTPAGEGSLP